MKKLTNQEVIQKLKSFYGDSLDYSKVNYINSRSNITLICPKHGEFEQYANNALTGRGGCPKCKLGICNKEEFVKTAIERFGNKFNYDKTQFVNLSTKVTITCPEHGDFQVIPRQFLISTYGCNKCRPKKEKHIPKTKNEKQTEAKNKWIQKCQEIHQNFYDYSKVNYIDSKTKVCIICPIHGEFWQLPNVHQQGCGCQKCSYESRGTKTRITQEEFEQRARERWGNRFKYGKYKGMHSYIEVECPEHGIFKVSPHNHLKDCGCPICSESSGEQLIRNLLMENNIIFEAQYKIKIDSSINPSGFALIDFYLPEYSIFIEYNGEQHYMPIKHFGGEIKYQQQCLRDQFVRNYCKNNNITLIEIKYNTSINKIKSIIYDQIQKTY